MWIERKLKKKKTGLELALYKFAEQILTCLGWSELKRVLGMCHRGWGDMDHLEYACSARGQTEMEIHPSVLLIMSRKCLKIYLCAQLLQLDAPS